MCTVSYLPTGEGQFILTSNRDEAPSRHSGRVVVEQQDFGTLFYPEVPGTPGSWIMASDQGRVACLLNGATGPVPPGKQYPKSRGSVVLDYFSSTSIRDLAHPGQLKGTAPFTLVALGQGGLLQLVWDGKGTMLSELEIQKPCFWSSATLYAPSVRAWRKKLFQEWLDSREHFRQEDIIHFHKTGGSQDPENGFLMNRQEIVKTLSVTSIRAEAGNLDFLYIDLENQAIFHQEIPVQHDRVLS